jgi:hypothetical protein
MRSVGDGLLLTVLVLVLATTARCWSKVSLFLLGDSVSVRWYQDGLRRLFKCTKKDPFSVIPLEHVGKYYVSHGFVCQDEMVERIGFVFHWGMHHDNDSYVSWKWHRSDGDSTDSIANILRAQNEFRDRVLKQYQNISKSDLSSVGRIVYVFSSALWDVARYSQHLKANSNIHEDKSSRDQFFKEYSQNYSNVLCEMYSSPISSVYENVPVLSENYVIQLPHFLDPNHPYSSLVQNISTILQKEIVPLFGLPVFPPAVHNCTLQVPLMSDGIHPTSSSNRLWARCLQNLLNNLPLTTPKFPCKRNDSFSTVAY